MVDPYDPHFEQETPQRSKRTCFVVLCVTLGIGALGIAAVLAFLLYLGVVGPETSVYAGSQVPERFVKVLHEVEALEPGERLLFFYSDAWLDVRDGFYFVSDRKVAVYSAELSEPLEAVPFADIADAELTRDTSFWLDSQITLELQDGSTLWFPVSSEMERDVAFFEAIEKRIGD